MPRFTSTKLPRCQHKTQIVIKYVQSLLLRALEPVLSQKRYQGFYSPLFLIKKKTGDLRPVLDLRELNKYIRVQKFPDGVPRLDQTNHQPGGVDVILRLERSLFTCPSSLAVSQVFTLCDNGTPLSIHLFPIRPINIPRTFSKVLLPVIAMLRKQGLQVSHYLDNVLLVTPGASSPNGTPGNPGQNPSEIGLDNQLAEKSTDTNA